MTDWRLRSGSASFRGAAFYVDSGDRAGGRRTAAHEIPFSEDPPYSEDMGRQTRTFSVEGYVLGTEYVGARDQLLTALEKAGPGELVHPYYGTRRVVVTGYKVKESRQDGGMALFSMEFRETVPAPRAPAAAVDAPALVSASAAGVRGVAGTQFLAGYTRAPGFTESILAALDSVAAGLDQVLAVVALGEQGAATLRSAVDALAEGAAALVADPQAILEAVGGILSTLAEELAAVGGVLSPSGSLLRVYDIDLGPRPTGTTPSRVVEQRNYDAFKALVQRLVLAEAAVLVAGEAFDSYDAALAGRSAVADRIDLHLESTSDDAYYAMQDLRVSVVRAVPGEDRSLPRLQAYTPPATVPSLVLAHRLYGDVTLEADLVARNRVRDPGAVPGGQPLEVLSRG